MSSSEMLETPPEKRRGLARRRARMVAVPAMLLSLTVGGLGVSTTAHAADSPQCPPTAPPTCGAANKGKAPVTGDEQHPGKLTPGKMQAVTLDYWKRFGWPNWRGIGDRDASWKVEDFHDQRGHHYERWIETGGRYFDNGDSLRDFMNEGHAGASSSNYRGTFQEYIAHYFDHDPSGEGERTGQDRFVRAINTGDLWFTRDHYKTFTYLGKF